MKDQQNHAYMRDSWTRRSVLQGVATALGATALSGTVVGRSDDTYIVDMSTASMDEMGDVEVVYDYREAIDYVAVRCDEDDLPSSASYAADMTIGLDVPQQEAMDVDATEMEEPLYDLQWDKQEQQIQQVHDTATGDGVRLGVIDDGVLGANPASDAAHPDLPNVRSDLSVNLTGDGQGPGALGDDHGTHVAGTAAAVDNGVGVVGMAPDAEVVDLRVFSGSGASFIDIVAAVIVGAAPEGEPVVTVNPVTGEPRVFEGAGCDVLNLSLGSGPIPEDAPGTDVLVEFVSSGGRFARQQGTLALAAAGNAATNLDAGFVNLPSGADGFMSVGATGPIGFGWPVNGRGKTVGGMTLEQPIQTELPTEEIANYTNYGADSVDVTAPGGNFDNDAFVSFLDNGEPFIFYDLVFSTTFQPVYDSTNPDAPENGGDGDGSTEDERPDAVVPSFGFKAGTSFACPNAAGFAALLYELDPDAGPEAVRAQIEKFAQPLPVGRAGETTAPGAPTNEASDGDFDGDQPSSPGAAPGPFDTELYRGNGHINVLPAVRTFGKGR